MSDYPPDRVLVPYRLPASAGGRIVQVDDSAAKGAKCIDFTLAGGRIVTATRMPENRAGLSERHWAALPLLVSRVENTPEGAAKLKAIWKGFGAHVRIFARSLTVGGAKVQFWIVVARRKQPKGQTANETDQA